MCSHKVYPHHFHVDGRTLMTNVCASMKTVAAFLLLATSCYAQSDFTIIVLPDTQYYSKTYPQIFQAQTKWIASQAALGKVQLVIGVGDIVDGNTTTQWTNADSAIKNIETVPYLLAIGNHDYD